MIACLYPLQHVMETFAVLRKRSIDLNMQTLKLAKKNALTARLHQLANGSLWIWELTFVITIQNVMTELSKTASLESPDALFKFLNTTFVTLFPVM